MFFKAALNGTFKEAAEGKVLLPEDDPETFERFLQWIYTKAYNIFPPTSGFSETLWEYVRLYLFAEKAQVEPLKDQVIRQLFTFFGQWPLNQLLPYECVEFAYDHTLPESQLRRVLVARYTWLDAKIESKAIAAIPEFAGDVAAALQQRIHNRNSSSPFNESFDSFLSNIKKSK